MPMHISLFFNKKHLLKPSYFMYNFYILSKNGVSLTYHISKRGKSYGRSVSIYQTCPSDFCGFSV